MSGKEETQHLSLLISWILFLNNARPITFIPSIVNIQTSLQRMSRPAWNLDRRKNEVTWVEGSGTMKWTGEGSLKTISCSFDFNSLLSTRSSWRRRTVAPPPFSFFCAAAGCVYRTRTDNSRMVEWTEVKRSSRRRKRRTRAQFDPVAD